MLKKLLAGLLAAMLVVSVTGCDRTVPVPPPGDDTSAASTASGEDMLADSALTNDQIHALAFGAVLGMRNDMDYKTLAGLPDSYIPDFKEGLEESWDVIDHATAIETLEWLKTEGHRLFYYDDAYNIYMGREETNDELNDFFKAEIDACQPVYDTLKEDYGYTDEELQNVNTTAAWDYDRMVTVARWCYFVGYISEDEAWTYINTAVEMAKADYTSWREYFAGVLYGRTMFSEAIAVSVADKNIADALLLDENSIYNAVAF